MTHIGADPGFGCQLEFEARARVPAEIQIAVPMRGLIGRRGGVLATDVFFDRFGVSPSPEE